MKRIFFYLSILAAVALFFMASTLLSAQQSLTWEQVKARFEAANPALKADALEVNEVKADEKTAFLRPNPQLTVSSDGTQIARHDGVWQPLSGNVVQTNFSYLHERERKRELRLESARQGTQISASEHDDLERNLLFDLRSQFVQTLEAKAVLDLSKKDLEYYDKIIEISRSRFKAGDLAQIDLDRIELLRVQYEVEFQTAQVSLRTAKIHLLELLNDRTPIEQFDVTGPFDINDELKPLEEFRKVALDSRPDLRAALETIQQAKTDHKLAVANGSTDPTLSAWYTWNPSFNNPNDQQTLGLSVMVPLRIFDRNQGEKQRTQIDIEKKQQLTEATRAQVFSDVDSAYAQVESNLTLLKPYKTQYREQAVRVRDTVTYAYEHGGASLMDFLNAQSDYRAVQLAYLQLIGSTMTAAGQLNLAVGGEVIQ
ncbi:MAG: TolC family protein [Acidobacteriaceae bacterium]|nr:TolC family protein [Acidobacteriaceae bacterium]